MRSRKVLLSFSLVLLLIWTLYTSCGIPTRFEVKDVIATNPMVSTELLYAICSVVSRCNSQVNVDTCLSGVLTTSGFASPLGLSSAAYGNLGAIQNAEVSGTLLGNQVAGSTCYGQVNALACSDPLVLAAYNSSSANPFGGTPGMISGPSCSRAYVPEDYASVILADSPLAYWRLDESSGTTAFDVMGNSNGTYTVGSGLTFGVLGALTGSSDTAVGFSHGATGGQVDMNVSGINTTPGTYVTVEFWMRWSGAAFDMMPFGFQGYDLILWNGLAPNVTFGFNTGHGDVYGIPTSAIPALSNMWVHVVAVMENLTAPSDITNNKLYLNSNLQVLSQRGAPGVTAATTNFRISSWGNDTSMRFDGSLDEFAIYNYAMSPAQVTRHYQAGRGVMP